jgi:hypothetical protein
VSAEAGNGTALVSVAASQTAQTELPQQASRQAHHVDRHRIAPRPGHAARLTIARSVPSPVARSSTTQPDLELALALVLVLVLAAVGSSASRWRGVR